MKNFLLIFLFLLIANKSFAREVTSVSWSYNGDTGYNSCMMILSFICSFEPNVKSDKFSTSINEFIVIYNESQKN